MASNVPAKLVLKGTSHMSLNERFGKLPSQKQIQERTNAQRQETREQQQASARNRRLALQMANRPSVRTALGFTPPTQQSQAMPSPRGRGGVRGRGGRGRGGRPALASPVRAPAKTRLSLRGNSAATAGVTRGATRGRGRGVVVGRGAIRGQRGGTRGAATMRGRLGGAGDGHHNNRGRGALRGRGVATSVRGGRGAARGRGAIRGRGAASSPTAAAARGRRRGRGGRGGGGSERQVSVAGLDRELDVYMAQSKSIDDALLL